MGSFETRSASGLRVLPKVARDAILAFLEDRPPASLAVVEGVLGRRAAVFVTLKNGGELRGCIGELEPRCDDLVSETRDRAVAAAFRDPRFPPLEAAELPRCTIEVTILGALEPVASVAALDPAGFGVVVTDGDGRRGVLLPGIEGVDTPEQQIEIARRKAEIAAGAAVEIHRFRAVKLSEE